MGIVELWKLLGPSERQFTLEQLSENTSERRDGKGLRVAIDVAIWTFQAKASVCGDQSELRSLFYRFNRLYELGIRPVFVFDGPNRPNYKRNKNINTEALQTTFKSYLVQLIKCFNFSMWEADGEAEAECAMLERLGFVDMVFTTDSDIFLFGAKRVVRQWPSKRNEPVGCYDITWVADAIGLDRSDLILVALLRGCDYDMAGTRGIGVTTAAQLAKCHHHRKLMDDIELVGKGYSLDDERVRHLFDSLTYELHNNGSGQLKRKQSSVTLDQKFFEVRIVIDFIHPTTNIASVDPEIIALARRLKHNLDFYHEPDWVNLAQLTQTAFGWPAEYVLKRFSALLYPGYMASRLRRQQPNYTLPSKAFDKPLSNSQQSTLEDYYRSTPRFRQAPDINKPRCDLVEITHSKVSKDNLKLYRVQWDKSTWLDFQEKLKTKLDFQLFKDTEVIDNDEEGVAITTTTGAKGKDIDHFSLVKRQWVNARYVHNAYPSLALAYQNKASDKIVNTGRQTKLDTFLIIPQKRRR